MFVCLPRNHVMQSDYVSHSLFSMKEEHDIRQSSEVQVSLHGLGVVSRSPVWASCGNLSISFMLLKEVSALGQFGIGLGFVFVALANYGGHFLVTVGSR